MTKTFSPTRILKFAVFAALAVLLPSGCASGVGDQAVSKNSAGLQMFEWNWKSVGQECTSHLGKEGYKWVLVAPPQEHIIGDQWWVHYQPTSYKIDSSLGTRAEFAQMVVDCRNAGVSVIADAVINHMAASETDGWAGTKHGKYNYPGLYGNADFHHCTEANGGSASGGIEDWNSLKQVQECELLGLADLNTGSQHVRDQLVGYLKDLRSLGVKGFRVDAAKHIAVSELKQITDALPGDTSWLFEVYDGPADPAKYREFGNTFGFNWAKSLPSMFSTPGMLGGQASAAVLATLDKSDATITLVTNHDTERDGSTLTYRNGKAFELANMFMLAIPYGKPMVYSGYAFSDRDASPPTDSKGRTLAATCPANSNTIDGVAAAPNLADGTFVCEHRWPGITGMIKWRAAVGDASIQNVYNKGSAYGFSRGDKGFVLFNTSTDAFKGVVKTSLPAGGYCNLAVTGALTQGASCTPENTFAVAKDGTVAISIPAMSAVALSR